MFPRCSYATFDAAAGARQGPRRARQRSARGDWLLTARAGDVLDRPTEELQARRVELIRPFPEPAGSIEPPLETVRDRFPGEKDHIGRPIDQVQLRVVADRRPHQLDAG